LGLEKEGRSLAPLGESQAKKKIRYQPDGERGSKTVNRKLKERRAAAGKKRERSQRWVVVEKKGLEKSGRIKKKGLLSRDLIRWRL